MSGKQRRQTAKKSLTNKDPKVITENVIGFTVKQYSAAVMLCLKDKLGFGPVRAQRFMNNVEELFDAINQGYLSLEDVIQTVEEELKITIK
jgi:hypothetical protein